MEMIAREKDLKEIARDLLARFGNTTIFALEGPLGAGKTTLIKAFCEVLGVVDVVASPTFSIVNEYHTAEDEQVYHFDFYRIDDLREAVDTGYYEYIESGSFCFIEWPDKIRELLPDDIVYIRLEESGNPGERTIRADRVTGGRSS